MNDLDQVSKMSDCVTSKVAGLVSRLRIAHHVPGRVRLKLEEGAGLAGAAAEVQAFVKSLDAVDGIGAVSLNLLARSCTVEYDPRRIAPNAWRDLIAGVDSPDAERLAEILAERWSLIAAQ